MMGGAELHEVNRRQHFAGKWLSARGERSG